LKMPAKKQNKGGKKSTKEQYYEVPSDPERAKLRPVLELLDEQHPKNALKAIDTVLKKWPQSLFALTLRALCLSRCGDSAESIVQADNVMSHHPTHPDILRFLMMVLRPAGLTDRATELYEASWEKYSTSEEVGEALFMCYVRGRNYEKQQSFIGQLISKFPKSKNPYTWWRVASIYSQARFVRPEGAQSADVGADGAFVNKKLLGLCEVMTSMLIKNNQMKTSNQAEFYITVLRDQGKYEAVADLLEDPKEGEKLSLVASLIHLDTERLEALADAHEHLKHWNRASEIYQQLLIKVNSQILMSIF